MSRPNQENRSPASALIRSKLPFVNASRNAANTRAPLSTRRSAASVSTDRIFEGVLGAGLDAPGDPVRVPHQVVDEQRGAELGVAPELPQRAIEGLAHRRVERLHRALRARDADEPVLGDR